MKKLLLISLLFASCSHKCQNCETYTCDNEHSVNSNIPDLVRAPFIDFSKTFVNVNEVIISDSVKGRSKTISTFYHDTSIITIDIFICRKD